MWNFEITESNVLFLVCMPGGVTLLRAAAKNHARVTVVCDPSYVARDLCVLQNMKCVKEMFV